MDAPAIQESLVWGLHDRKVMRTNGLATVLARTLRGLLDEPVDVAVEPVQCVASGVAAVALDHRLDLRGNEQHLLRTAATAARLTLFRFRHFNSPFEANLFYTGSTQSTAETP